MGWIYQQFLKLFAPLYIPDISSNVLMVDSDVVFHKQIPYSIHQKALDQVGMFYFFGNDRRKRKYGYETGLLGFNLNKGGADLLRMCFQIYDDGSYRKFPRWDDGYIFRMMNENSTPLSKECQGIQLLHDFINRCFAPLKNAYCIFILINKKPYKSPFCLISILSLLQGATRECRACAISRTWALACPS